MVKYDDSLGKIPPQALDLEEAVLGALMMDKNAINAIEFLAEDHFYSDAHAKIFKAITDLSKESRPIDMRTVKAQLQKNGHLEMVGGAYALAELTSKVSSALNVEYHSRLIYEKYLKRSIIQMCNKFSYEGYDDTKDAFELIEELESAVFKAGLFNFSSEYEILMEIGKREIVNINKRSHMSGLTGINTGFRRLNDLTGGWQKKDLIIIAARPGMGKTAFFLSSCRIAAEKHPIGIFSLEMGKEQLYNRLVGADHEIEINRLQQGRLNSGEYERIIRDVKGLHKLPVYIDDTPGISISQLRTKARRMKQKHDIQLLVVDYLQLMSGEGQNREQEISSISRGLKGIAKSLDIPVIALSQLSRGVEQRGGDKRPQLSDLRESGSIEQDADIVMFLYRPEYYGISVVERPNGETISSSGMGDVIIAKNRNGGLDSVPIRFIGKFTKFLDYDTQFKPLSPDRTIEPENNQEEIF